MSDHIRDAPLTAAKQSSAHDFNYPWAAAPDIIRSHQKDAYFQSVLLTRFTAVVRSLYGARAAHNWTGESRVLTEILYLGLTTFLGNRTLGEEYCDIVQVEDDTHRLPSLTRRSGYIFSSVLLPYILTRFLPVFRRRVRAKLEFSLRKAHQARTSASASASSPSSSSSSLKKPASPNRIVQFQEYILKHLDDITSPAPYYAISLAVFYFSGAYYQLSKRLFGLRYIFTRQVEPSDRRAGYEILGVLLVLQMTVQTWLHASETYAHVQSVPSNNAALVGGSAVIDGGVEIGTDAQDFSTPLLFEAPAGGRDPDAQKDRLAAITDTPRPMTEDGYRFNLKDERVMPWIEGTQQRKCTLCLEPMRDPSATTCGHVFCWECITDWLREQSMCPLCRQAALVQHVLPLRG